MDAAVCGFVTDGPHIVCDSVGVEFGQRDVCLRCHVTARPTPTSVYWKVGANDSEIIDDDAHWAVVQVMSDFVSLYHSKPAALPTKLGPIYKDILDALRSNLV